MKDLETCQSNEHHVEVTGMFLSEPGHYFCAPFVRKTYTVPITYAHYMVFYTAKSYSATDEIGIQDP